MSARGIERRGWLCAGALTAASVLLHNPAATVGVAAGALVALVNYRLLCRFVQGVLARPGSRKAALLWYPLKFMAFGIALYFLFKHRIADGLAVAAGASVLLPAILWETLGTSRQAAEEV